MEMFKELNSKLAFFCSYTPVEIISSCDFLPYRIFPPENTAVLDSKLHPTLCSFVRGAFSQVHESRLDNLQGAVLLNSCHAMNHLYQALESYTSLPFFYFFHFPRDNSFESQEFLSREFVKFHRALAEFKGEKPGEDKLWEHIELYRKIRLALQELARNSAVKETERLKLLQDFMISSPLQFLEVINEYRGEKPASMEKCASENSCENGKMSSNQLSSSPRIYVCGSIMSLELVKLIEELGGTVVEDDLCSGRRAVDFSAEYYEEALGEEDPYWFLARHYLSRDPCPRMNCTGEKLSILQHRLKEKRVDGVILFYLKFCEPWYYFGQVLREKIAGEIPFLVLEEEYSIKGGIGQLQTRIAAFMEMLGRR